MRVDSIDGENDGALSRVREKTRFQKGIQTRTGSRRRRNRIVSIASSVVRDQAVHHEDETDRRQATVDEQQRTRAVKVHRECTDHRRRRSRDGEGKAQREVQHRSPRGLQVRAHCHPDHRESSNHEDESSDRIEELDHLHYTVVSEPC